MTLDAEEQAAADAIEAEERAQRTGPDGGLAGEISIHWQVHEVAPFVFGPMLALIIGGLSEIWVGLALFAVIASAFVVYRGRRRSRLQIGPSGSLTVSRHGEVDWPSVRRLEVRYRYPFLSTRRERQYSETLAVRFTLGDGQVLSLPRGPLWRRKPRREPIGCYRLERWLRSRAIDHGMRVTPDGEKGWVATGE